MSEGSELAIGRPFQEAFEACAGERAALAKEELRRPNLSIPRAVRAILGAMEKILALRPAILEELPRFDISQLDRLELYARQAGHAHALHLAASTAPEAIPGLAAQVTEQRGLLESDLRAAARRGLLDGKPLEQLDPSTAHDVSAFNLLALVQMARAAWPRLQGQSGITLKELDQAEALADRLITAVGLRDQETKVWEATETRQRAFTLFLNAYNAVERAGTYLRWEEGDLDTILPPLWLGRPRRAPETALAAEDETEPGGTATPVTTTGAVPGSPAAPIPAGFPGAKPFED